jgi:hypothetical protein
MLAILIIVMFALMSRIMLRPLKLLISRRPKSDCAAAENPAQVTEQRTAVNMCRKCALKVYPSGRILVLICWNCKKLLPFIHLIG